MFLQAVYRLWYFDVKARRRFQIQTILIAFAYGVFSSLVLGRPEKRVTWETLGLICFLTVGFTLFYALREEPWKVRSAYRRLREFFGNRGYYELGLTSVAVLVLFSLVRYVPITKVQAFSYDLQLQQAISAQKLGPGAFDTIVKVVTTATARQVPLSPRLVNAAGRRVLEDSRENPGAWPATLAFLSYRSSLNSETSPYAQGRCLGAPTSGFVGVEALTLDCSGQAQVLDHIAWKNVVIENSTVVYHGGPAILENVQFKNSRFILDYSPGSHELAKALTASNTVTITLPGR